MILHARQAPDEANFVSDSQPLLFYEAIAGYALKHLNNRGLLFFEFVLGAESVFLIFNSIQILEFHLQTQFGD
jgi:hypothetical protein